jgi:hypothetical protein
MPVPCFLLFFVFQKSYTRNILRIGWNKSQTSRNLPKLPENQRGVGGGPGPAHIVGQCGPGPSRAPYVCGRPGPLLTMPFAYKDPWREKPKYPIRIPERYCDPPPSSTQDWEGPKALPGTLPERGIATGGLLHRHACFRSDEWVVYLGLWVHSSS